MRIENSNVRLSIKTSNIETKVIGHRKEKLESMFIPKGRDEKTFDSKRLKQIAQSEARININISKAIKIMSRRVKKVQNENKLIGFKGKIEDINIGERLKEEN